MTGKQRPKQRIVFAGLARDVAAFIPPLRANVARWAELFAQSGLILVENGSRDSTPIQLRAWVASENARAPGSALLLQPEGLDQRHPLRTDRLAACRNLCLETIAASPMRDFEYLAVFDMDRVNAAPMPAAGFLAAVDFLEGHPEAVGVFANQVPAYYDIWALRAEGWCDGDCWHEIRQSGLPEAEAIKQFVDARQRFIDPAGPPIAVDSAFGGLGIYRLPAVLKAAYRGLDSDGKEVCEHVAFHRSLRDAGGQLYILPFLLNTKPS